MNRLFKITALFATVVSLSVLASEVQANSQVKVSKKYTPQNTNSTTTNGTSIFGGTLTNPPAPSYPNRHFLNGNFKALGGLFNQPTTPTFPFHHIPPNGWKAIGPVFNQPTPAPTNPPKGSGMGHGWGFGGGSFGGGVVVGGTAVNTAAPVAAPTAAPTAPADAAAPATTASDADNAMQIAAGSTFTLNGEKFGDKAGRIGVLVGDVLIPAEVLNWSDNAITVALPQVGVGSAAKATFLVQRADGSTAKATSFEMVAAK